MVVVPASLPSLDHWESVEPSSWGGTSWGGREPLPLELRVQVLLPPSQVYAMLLSSFLCFAIRSGRSLDRKGTYTLSPR